MWDNAISGKWEEYSRWFASCAGLTTEARREQWTRICDMSRTSKNIQCTCLKCVLFFSSFILSIFNSVFNLKNCKQMGCKYAYICIACRYGKFFFRFNNTFYFSYMFIVYVKKWVFVVVVIMIRKMPNVHEIYQYLISIFVQRLDYLREINYLYLQHWLLHLHFV